MILKKIIELTYDRVQAEAILDEKKSCKSGSYFHMNMSPQDGLMEYNFNFCDCGGGIFSPETGKYQIPRVKFGVPLSEVFKNDIPGPLLVLILKLNKEGPFKKDVFRAPGHQGNMKKLIHFLQNGRLVNIENFSVYTIASVLKKFLRKLPDGIFGREGEQQLFYMIDKSEELSIEEQRDQIHTLISSLPLSTQRLIVLLFGTFRVIASNSDRSHTGMTSEALGVSVAPSFFQSCVSDGKTAKMEDVLRFKAEIDVATKIMKFLIDNFGVSNLFGRENYEYYARITGRILKVEEDWIFSFRYPPDGLVSRLTSLEAERTWLQHESERWGLKFNLAAISQQEESQSTPALLQSEGVDIEDCEPSCSSLTIIPENNLLDCYTRLSISLEDNGLFKDTIEEASSTRSSCNLQLTLDELRAVNHYAESTKSLSFLPQVHERQAARMKTRSEWFLSPSLSSKSSHHDIEFCSPTNQYYFRREESFSNRQGPGSMFSSSVESVKHLVRRTSSKEKERRIIRRTSSKKNKENGSSSSKLKSSSKEKPNSPIYIQPTSSSMTSNSDPDPLNNYSLSPQVLMEVEKEKKISSPEVFEEQCTETDVQTFHVTLTYKPRI